MAGIYELPPNGKKLEPLLNAYASLHIKTFQW